MRTSQTIKFGKIRLDRVFASKVYTFTIPTPVGRAVRRAGVVSISKDRR